MSPLLIPLLSFGSELISKFIQDPNEKAKAEFELLKMTQAGELSVTLKQLEINLAEAQSSSRTLWNRGFRLIKADADTPTIDQNVMLALLE